MILSPFSSDIGLWPPISIVNERRNSNHARIKATPKKLSKMMYKQFVFIALVLFLGGGSERGWKPGEALVRQWGADEIYA
jgi:hypothetical protein